METDPFRVFMEMQLQLPRNAPGSDRTTASIFRMLKTLADEPEILVMGCGQGNEVLTLLRESNGRVTAVDIMKPFITRLEKKAEAAHVSGERLPTVCSDFEALDLPHGYFDLIWSEGAIYSMGFEAGIKNWRSFLKPGGILAVSELTWLTSDRPAELTEHWSGEYAEVATASEKMAQLEAQGYVPGGYFPLPQSSWLDTYYRPMQERFGDFLARHDNSVAAQSIVDAERHEISLYERYAAFVSYGFSIARKRAD